MLQTAAAVDFESMNSYSIRVRSTDPFGLFVEAARQAGCEVMTRGQFHGNMDAVLRGPQQNGTSLETDLPDRWTVDGENHRWTYELAGRGTPAIGSANDTSSNVPS